MAREIMILQKLDHPNVVKLEGLAPSRIQYSLYLVFDFMKSDLSKIILCPEGKLTEPRHCHDRGILHRDIKGSNLLIDKDGMLKIADFGLSNYYSPKQKQPLTTRVVTLWYRAPELLLGATDYGTGIDLWSAVPACCFSWVKCYMQQLLSGLQHCHIYLSTLPLTFGSAIAKTSNPYNGGRAEEIKWNRRRGKMKNDQSLKHVHEGTNDSISLLLQELIDDYQKTPGL
uniref:Protein kinase domain-containing protein n=1 Tax=Salix viminalis TaxID=40686 RepID=A0A6N2K3Q5_SALVM